MAISFSARALEPLLQSERFSDQETHNRLLQLESMIPEQHLLDFLSMAVSYLTIDSRLYFYKWLEPMIIRKRNGGVVYALVYVVDTTHGNKQRGWKIIIGDLIRNIIRFIAEEKDSITSWSQLPISLHRAFECYMKPEGWSFLPNFKRCEITLPRELYAVFDVSLYEAIKQQHVYQKSRRSTEEIQAAATVAAYALLKTEHREISKVRRAYSALRLHLETGNSTHSSDLAKQILERRKDSSFSRLCAALDDFHELLQWNQKNKSSRYYLRDATLTEAGSTLPYEQVEIERLRKKLNSRIRQLRFDAKTCSVLQLHSTMSYLRRSYPSHYCTDYCVYRDDSSVYLVLSKDYHKFIVGVLLPNMRVNGHFRKDVLPVFPQVAEGLINGDSSTLRYSLQTVYDMIISWSCKQSYFKKQHDMSTLSASVVLLCKYAGCFNSPEELCMELRKPYTDVNRHYDSFNLSSDGSTVLAMEAVYCPQETIKAIILLEESHYIHLDVLTKLYNTVCKEKKGQHSAHYSAVNKWANQLYRGRESYRRKLAIKKGGCVPRHDWMHIHMSLEALYSYFTDGRCFGSAEARYYCDRLLVHADRRNRFRTPVPTQSPGLSVITALQVDKRAAKVYREAITNCSRRKKSTPYPQLTLHHIEKLYELLKQVEYLRMHSNIIDSQHYRAFHDVADYANDLPVRRLIEEKLRRPPFLLKDVNLKCCKQLFPVHSSSYYAPEIPNRLLHTTETELLAYVLYTPLPAAACVQNRKRKQ